MNPRVNRFIPSRVACAFLQAALF
ncbi:MAG: hypothetical protein JWM26_3570, partial [Betaproteobacteria bacterium]|nr:hypothetical protein [Betaproteobacteria bacterium]